MSSEKTNELNRILVVDDTAADRSLFKYVLTRAGFVVGVAVDGADALTILAREEYDVVLCDYQMPNVDGYEFHHQDERTQTSTGHDVGITPPKLFSAKRSASDRRSSCVCSWFGTVAKYPFRRRHPGLSVKRWNVEKGVSRDPSCV